MSSVANPKGAKPCDMITIIIGNGTGYGAKAAAAGKVPEQR
jgi:hypothetical protein